LICQYFSLILIFRGSARESVLLIFSLESLTP
jgi:hypothetical protein